MLNKNQGIIKAVSSYCPAGKKNIVAIKYNVPPRSGNCVSCQTTVGRHYRAHIQTKHVCVLYVSPMISSTHIPHHIL